MAQHKFKLNDTVVRQPDSGIQYEFETTYATDSGRTQTGDMNETVLFTVEKLGYAATGLTVSEMSALLTKVAKGGRVKVHYFSPYYGAWRDDYFYVGQGSLQIGSWLENKEQYDAIAFNLVGVNPL